LLFCFSTYFTRLVENEIGGVIQGSLKAALKREPLTEKEYLQEIRSNIPTKTEEGKQTRIKVYKYYEEYRQWKINNGKYDIGDIVLELISSLRPNEELFQSAYLDEVSWRFACF
jgi:ribosome recycling factor